MHTKKCKNCPSGIAPIIIESKTAGEVSFLSQDALSKNEINKRHREVVGQYMQIADMAGPQQIRKPSDYVD